jgi:hypothetical protein
MRKETYTPVHQMSWPPSIEIRETYDRGKRDLLWRPKQKDTIPDSAHRKVTICAVSVHIHGHGVVETSVAQVLLFLLKSLQILHLRSARRERESARVRERERARERESARESARERERERARERESERERERERERESG